MIIKLKFPISNDLTLHCTQTYVVVDILMHKGSASLYPSNLLLKFIYVSLLPQHSSSIKCFASSRLKYTFTCRLNITFIQYKQIEHRHFGEQGRGWELYISLQKDLTCLSIKQIKCAICELLVSRQLFRAKHFESFWNLINYEFKCKYFALIASVFYNISS